MTALRTLLVQDLMTPHPVGLGPQETIEAARLVLVERRFRHLPIVEADGRICGLVTRRDIQSHMAAGGDQNLPIATVMVKDVETTTPTAPIGDAARFMFQSKKGCMPAVDDDGKLVGILTESDFLRWFVRNT